MGGSETLHSLCSILNACSPALCDVVFGFSVLLKQVRVGHLPFSALLWGPRPRGVRVLPAAMCYAPSL